MGTPASKLHLWSDVANLIHGQNIHPKCTNDPHGFFIHAFICKYIQLYSWFVKWQQKNFKSSESKNSVTLKTWVGDFTVFARRKRIQNSFRRGLQIRRISIQRVGAYYKRKWKRVTDLDDLKHHMNEKLSYRREAARCLVLLSTLVSRWRLL